MSIVLLFVVFTTVYYVVVKAQGNGDTIYVTSEGHMKLRKISV